MFFFLAQIQPFSQMLTFFDVETIPCPINDFQVATYLPVIRNSVQNNQHIFIRFFHMHCISQKQMDGCCIVLQQYCFQLQLRRVYKQDALLWIVSYIYSWNQPVNVTARKKVILISEKPFQIFLSASVNRYLPNLFTDLIQKPIFPPLIWTNLYITY